MTAILFWSTFDYRKDTSIKKWKSRSIDLSPFHVLPLASHAKYNNDAILYTYQTETLLPEIEGVTVKDAAEIFPIDDAFYALLGGHSIAHIADLVRLRAASECSGTVVDMDTILLRPLPQCDGFFASIPAKATGGVAPQWGNNHPPLTVHDCSWSGKALANFPIKVSKVMAPYTRALSRKIGRTLLKPPQRNSKGWNYVMWTLKEIMKIDKDAIVAPPMAFGPLPAWLTAGKCYSLEAPTRLNGNTTLYGYTLPSINDILNNTFMVQHFFESTFKKSKRINQGFWDADVPDGCLVAQEAKHIMGDNWRQQLSVLCSYTGATK
mgnify:CR=1 FL=1